jgi:hypothetical protein
MRADWRAVGRAILGVAIAALFGTAFILAFFIWPGCPLADWFIPPDPFGMCRASSDAGWALWRYDPSCLASRGADTWLRIFATTAVAGLPIYLGLRAARRAALPILSAAWAAAGLFAGWGQLVSQGVSIEASLRFPVVTDLVAYSLLGAVIAAAMAVVFRFASGVPPRTQP